MVNNNTKIRVFFQKTGRCKYISHLDINRCMQRALKRSGLPVWHTEGFHPHIYVTFALPLSLGYESLCESMDFELTEPVEFDTVITQINRVLPPDIRVCGAVQPQNKPAAIAWADYGVVLHTTAQADALAASWDAFVAQAEILVIKKTKKGEKEMDIKPYFQALDTQFAADKAVLKLRIAAGTTLNINPNLVTDVFCKFAALECAGLDVVREQIYTNTLEKFR